MTNSIETDNLRRLAYDVEHGWETETGPSLRAAADEVDRLRAVIAGAAHAYPCTVTQQLRGEYPCRCWKAEAL